jgi:hypothetical protein
MNAFWRAYLPTFVSVGIIIIVTALRENKALAPILATMPLNIPLALWILSSAPDSTQQQLEQTSASIVVNLFPTLAFAIVVWWATRNGWSVWPSILTGYAVWGVLLFTLHQLRVGQ